MVGPLADSSLPGPRRLTAAEQAWDAVVAFVTAAPDGTRLPPERTFAERLGVSRSTLRSAIARLELLGLVEVRHGSGMVVRTPDPGRLWGLLLGAAGDPRELPRQALELRELLEPRLAAEAAQAREAFDPAGSDESGFHRAVAETGGNPLAGALVAALVALSGDADVPEPLHGAQHAAIAAAVAVGDAEAAKDAMASHMRSLRRAAAKT